MSKTAGIDTLSDRQKEILRLIAQHLQAKEVARALNISENTVKAHTDTARRRLGVASSRDAARLLVQYEAQLGLLPEGGYPPRGIGTDEGTMAKQAYEKSIYTERTISERQLERSGDGVEDVSHTRKAVFDRGDTAFYPDLSQERRAGEGGVYDDRRNGMANGFWDSFINLLKALNALQWLGLIIVIAIVMPLILGGLLEASLGTLQAIHQLKSHGG